MPDASRTPPGELPANPAQFLKLPKRIKTTKRHLSHDDVAADKGYQRIEAPKDYEHRSIPIPEFLVTMLEQQVAGRAGPQPVFFGMRTKTYLRNHAFRKGWFDPAATEVGLDGITPHELRHTAASLAVSGRRSSRTCGLC